MLRSVKLPVFCHASDGSRKLSALEFRSGCTRSSRQVVSPTTLSSCHIRLQRDRSYGRRLYLKAMSDDSMLFEDVASWRSQIVSCCCLKLSAVAALAILFAPEAANAHIIEGTQGGFGSGFAHPLTGPDHFLAMFAVGLWGAQMGGRSVWALPVTFPLIMVIGGVLGMAGLVLPAIEVGIALSILALGGAIALAWRPPEWIALILIAYFALCHGYAHGVELPLSTDPADYAIGFVLATGMIHLFGIGVGLALNKPMHGRLSRALGAVVGIGGIYFLVPALLAA